MADTK